MAYEFEWAVLVITTSLAVAAMYFLMKHFRRKQLFEQKYELRQLLHKERMAALDKDIPLIEIPSLEDEIFALTEEAVPELDRRRKLWKTTGIVLVAAAVGVGTAFFLSDENNLQEIWTLSLIPLALGCGCLIVGFND